MSEGCNCSKTAGNYVYAAPPARRKAILPSVYEQLQKALNLYRAFTGTLFPAQGTKSPRGIQVALQKGLIF
jgi:hypothetical protein